MFQLPTNSSCTLRRKVVLFRQHHRCCRGTWQQRPHHWRKSFHINPHHTHQERSIRTMTGAFISSVGSDRVHCSSLVKKQANNNKDMSLSARLEQQTNPFSTAVEKQTKEKKTAATSGDQALVDQLLSESDALMNQMQELPLLGPIWEQQQQQFLSESTAANTRASIFQQAQGIVETIQQHVEAGGKAPSRICRTEYLLILERVLYIYSQCAGTNVIASAGVKGQDDNNDDNSDSVYEHLMQLVQLMKKWDVDPRAGHVNHMVTIAAREGRWNEAANFYWDHIDPDVSGHTPVTVSVSTPTGLYAIARAAQNSGSAAVESVLDAVLRMRMVSPMDQEKYVLAAGTALGLAGEAPKFIEYLKTSYNASQLGQPLIAAVMQSCILCNMFDQAVEVLDEALGENVSERRQSQWAGGEDLLHPSCRELLMRAIGGSSSNTAAQRALQLFTETVKEGLPISVSAVHGVVTACEKARLWENAISVLFLVLDMQDMLTGKDYFPVRDGHASDNEPSEIDYYDFVAVIESVMRSCNAARQFGTALLCLKLAGWKSFGAGDDSVDLILGIPKPLWRCHTLLVTTSISLCGVQNINVARNVFQMVTSDTDVVLDHKLRRVHQHILSSRLKPTGLYPPWEVADEEIQRCLLLLHQMEANDTNNLDRDVLRLSNVLSSAIRSCTLAGEPNAGLYFGKWVESQQHMQQFDGLFTDSSDSNVETSNFWPDSLVAATIDANRKARNFQVAERLVGEYVLSSLSNPILSIKEAILLLSDMKNQETAVTLFQSSMLHRKNPDLFSFMAHAFVRKSEWPNVSETYRLASRSGCVSEQLAILAMKSVASTKGDGYLMTIQKIASDASRLSGMTMPEWLYSRYWTLHNQIPFSVMCELLGWRDPRGIVLEELEHALRDVESRIASGLTPKIRSIRKIVRIASNRGESRFHPDISRIPRVPKKREDWIVMVEKALDLAKETYLLSDAQFVHDAVMALQRWDRNDTCVELVKHMTEQGVRLPPSLISTSLASSQLDSLPELRADLELLSLHDVNSGNDSE